MLRSKSLNCHVLHPVTNLQPLSNTVAILPHKHIGNVGIDWLQVSFKGRLISNAKYEVRQIDLETKIFSKVYHIIYGGEVVATATTDPKSPILDPALVIIKIENKHLYVSDPILLMQDFRCVFKLVFCNITRIDLFRDFNEFKYGLKPHTLIDRFVQGVYLKRGKSEFKIFGNSNKKLDFSYLRFGGNTSDFQIYLYNKSKEMREVKTKPWVIERANAVGVDTSRDFWRLEVSCKSCKKEVVKVTTGEVSNPDLSYFASPVNVFEYYSALLVKYFDIRVNGGKSKTSRERKVELFSGVSDQLYILTPKNHKESNRTAKIVLRHLEKYNEFMRGESILGDLERRIFVEDYVHVHALDDYYAKSVSLDFKLL